MFKAIRAYAAPVIATGTTLVSTVSQAALDAAVSTELATAKADVLVIGGLVFSVAIGIVLYKWFKRAL